MEYVRNVEDMREEGCIFCSKPSLNDDRAHLILHRGETSFIILNLFPYNTGHVMVSPYRHVGQLEDLEEPELYELMGLTVLAVKVIKEELKPQAFNLGMNLGKAGGAGFDEHLHMHIVPRWQGDTNFMPVVAQAKVMPESLDDTYERLHESITNLLRK
jgi:ATP adenylyltransferase